MGSVTDLVLRGMISQCVDSIIPYVNAVNVATRQDVSTGVFMATDRQQAFLELVSEVAACRTCPRMEGRTRVLGPANGALNSGVLFVAEAPGRLGADLTGTPLYGDQTGCNFQALLDHAGIARESVFITNALLCNPRDDAGRNASPTSREIANCAGYLRRTIDLIQPRFVVALGRVALQALHRIEPHTIDLATDVGRRLEWYGRYLIPLYHPGARARVRRSLELQQQDFRRLAQSILITPQCQHEHRRQEYARTDKNVRDRNDASI
jgi:uracil-DNA glycosylase family 4